MGGDSKITLSVIKAGVGGFVGTTSVHPDLLDTAREKLQNAKDKGKVLDYHVLRCGDDIELVMTHAKGKDNRDIHGLAWNVFTACAEDAKRLKLHGAGGDLLKDAFSGNVKGMGPGVAEIEFIERKSEPVLIFMANKTSSGAWNLPLYRMFADPFSTSGLVMDATMMEGFSFTVLDAKEGKAITLKCPEETYRLLALIGATSRYAIQSVSRNSDGEPVSAASTQKSSFTAGKHARKDDPVAIVRCQSGFPAVGEALEPFAFPHLVEGWMRGSHTGPLMAVPFYEANSSRFDGPPRVICAGFQICEGRLIGPHDMFDDPAFDEQRRLAGKITSYMRRHGPFQPHRLPEEQLGHTAIPDTVSFLKDRFKKV